MNRARGWVPANHPEAGKSCKVPSNLNTLSRQRYWTFKSLMERWLFRYIHYPAYDMQRVQMSHWMFSVIMKPISYIVLQLNAYLKQFSFHPADYIKIKHLSARIKCSYRKKDFILIRNLQKWVWMSSLWRLSDMKCTVMIWRSWVQTPVGRTWGA